MSSVMEYRASHRYAHISAYKARRAADLIRGLDVNRAMLVLEYDQTRGAAFFKKVLNSAVANAAQGAGDAAVDVNRLYVKDARVDQGPLIHGKPRFRAGSMGRVMEIRRRTSHFLITVAPRREA
jgi:large subunit ribosomal protein L22